MPQDVALLPAAYLGPVQYYSKFTRYSPVLIEQYDHYNKQSYRNRCRVLGVNGPVDLSIPVKNIHGIKTLVKEVRIDYDKKWQKIHWRTITASYNKSPFFEYFKEDLAPFFFRKEKYLLDLNLKLHEWIMKSVPLECSWELTKNFSEDFKDGTDFRDKIHPKVSPDEDKEFNPVPYYQTFSEKHPFIPNLSIIDLLFNMGPETLEILKNSVV